MLVYANALNLEGAEAFDAAGRAIHGWLCDQLGMKLTYADLFKRNEWKSDHARRAAWLRSYAAADELPELYGWIMKHADDKVRGRQWLIELGLKREAEEVELSCTIQTEELSVLVTEPVSASRPRWVKYLLNNLKDESEARLAANVPGKSLRRVGADTDSYRALLATIEDASRDHPIVLVSPDKGGEYLINAVHLQESLLGLAQVVKVDTDSNSYDMEEVLGRHYSAWDGAANLISVCNRRGVAYGRFFLSDEVESWGQTQNKRIAHLLAFVTHQTNVPRLRKRIRCDGIAQLAMHRRLAAQRRKVAEQEPGAGKAMLELLEEGLTELTETNEALIKERDDAGIEVEQLKDENAALEQALRTERYNMRERLRQHQSTQGAAVDPTLLLRMAKQASQPSPSDCLDIIAMAYPERFVVLGSAFETAADCAHFTQGSRLLDMLERLGTDYIERMQDGGDDAARKVFTDNEYAANESEGTQNNKQMRQARTFKYKDRPLEMWRHLKIGVADDQRKSIRVYFEWLPDEKKIVIGHCGAHLPVISH